MKFNPTAFLRVLALLGCLLPLGSRAFTPLIPGPGDGNTANPWQTTPLGYELGGDIGVPGTPLEAYRWNVPLVTYSFSQAFINYFGTNGIRAIDEAMSIINGLPAYSTMSKDLGEYPLNTLQENAEAASLGLEDLKSTALGMVVEQLGLAEPERWVFCLRAAVPTGNPVVTNYSVMVRNFDPVTIAPSKYVNGTLYTYQIQTIRPGVEDAVEFQALTDDTPNVSVASAGGTTLGTGRFFTGLTRDDVGGLRFLLKFNRYAIETLPTNSATTVDSPWVGWINATNTSTTNGFGVSTNQFGTFIQTGLRPGINKVTFRKVYFDSLLGSSFSPITNNYTDYVITTNGNGRLIKQKVSRPITVPDIVFNVDDIGVVQAVPLAVLRTGTAAWVNNNALNNPYSPGLGGPGVITAPSPAPIELTFTDLLPYFLNTSPNFIDEPPDGGTGTVWADGFLWGSFDNNGSQTIVYPRFEESSSYTVDQLWTIRGLKP